MAERLVPRSTATTPDEQVAALAAPVRDPLWLLARQWQTGEFRASNGGSPVRVVLAHATAGTTTEMSGGSGPLEPAIEAEPPPPIDALDHARLVTLSTELVRLLRGRGAAAAVAALAREFPFAPEDPGPAVRPFAGRVPDPRSLRAALVPRLGPRGDDPAGTLPSITGLAPALVDDVRSACRDWLAWVSGQVGAGGPPTAWDPERLEYRFTVSARLPQAQVDLRADDYDGTGVEWHTFDRAGWDPAGGAGAAPSQVEVHPTPVSYPGMPRPGYWELEDGDVDLGSLAATDPAHAVLAAFAHQYSNDWFVVPLAVPPGVSTITALTVTDTFGVDVDVPPVARIDGGRGPWRLWDLDAVGDDGPDGPPLGAAGLRMWVPPTPRPLEGEVLEDVLLARDEMANLAWLVERLTRDRDGAVVDRAERYVRLRPAADPRFAPGAQGGRSVYRLGTTIPDHWYPLVAATGADGRPLLALATVPPEATGVSDDGVRGTLVAHADGVVIADEEVPREGAHLTRRDRLVTGGTSVLVWRARTKTAGLGESSSGLRFDVLD